MMQLLSVYFKKVCESNDEDDWFNFMFEIQTIAKVYFVKMEVLVLMAQIRINAFVVPDLLDYIVKHVILLFSRNQKVQWKRHSRPPSLPFWLS